MASLRKTPKHGFITDDSEDKYRVISSLAFLTVVIVIGVPVWWKTTEVYRVTLPHSDIKSLGTLELKISQRIGFYTSDQNRSASLIKELQASFQEIDVWNIQFIQITDVPNIGNVKSPEILESLILKNFSMRPGDFLFFEWEELTEEILLTTDRSALISKTASLTKIGQVLKTLILQTYKIQSIVDEKKQYGFKSSPPQPHYDVLISVANPRLDLLDVNWNVRLASEMYLAPFLNSINQVSNYTIKTQWVYQMPFAFYFKQIRDGSKIGRHYALAEEYLPHIITAIEKNLGGGISENPVIHIVVFIPPCDFFPLHIYENNESIAPKDYVHSFISPKWGSVIIYNPPLDICLEYNEHLHKMKFNVSSSDVMQVVLYQLQKLVDIDTDVSIDDVKMVDIKKLAPRIWQYESYIRSSAVNHLMTATRTLQSLISLLDDISYIVVNDDVGHAINEAYKEILIAIGHLHKNELIEASNAAKKAFILSEHAFFDASMLAQLYFPDEQKYAIYIPLFLPIMVPVITSLVAIKKYYFKTSDEEN